MGNYPEVSLGVFICWFCLFFLSMRTLGKGCDARNRLKILFSWMQSFELRPKRTAATVVVIKVIIRWKIFNVCFTAIYGNLAPKTRS